MDNFSRPVVKGHFPILSPSQDHSGSGPTRKPVGTHSEDSWSSNDGDSHDETRAPSAFGSRTPTLGNLLASAKSVASKPVARASDVAKVAAAGATTAAKSAAGAGVKTVAKSVAGASLETVQAIKSSAAKPIALASNLADAAATGATTAAKPGVDVSGKTTGATESSAANPIARAGGVANAAAASATTAAKTIAGADLAQAVKLSATRPISLFGNAANAVSSGVSAAAKSVGETIQTIGSSGGGFFTETTPLLTALRHPGDFAAKQAGALFFRLLYLLFSSLISLLPFGLLWKLFGECRALVMGSSEQLLINLQEHSLLVVPIIFLGHLSTTALAASAIGTAVASVTGYSIIQGFISSLNKILLGAPNRHVALIACARAAFVAGILILPIAYLWVDQSATILQQLGQPPEVAGLASEFLHIAIAGLPGYAISEITRRYLIHQGLRHVHTWVLSVIAFLNLVLSYLLVRGPIPALRLGFAGAPLCVVLSYTTLGITLIICATLLRTRREEAESLQRHVLATDSNHSEVTFSTNLSTLTFTGIFGVLRNASLFWSKDIGVVIAAILGPNALATQAVVLMTATTLYQVPKAVSNASSDRMATWIAKGKVRRTKTAAFAAFLVTLAGAMGLRYALIALATSWGRSFSGDPAIVESVSAVLPIIAVFQVVDGFGAWVDGALGSLGKPALFPSLKAGADYLIGILLGASLALGEQWGLVGLWVGLTVSSACSLLAATIVLVRIDWKSAVRNRGGKVPSAGEESPSTAEPGISGGFP